MRRFLKILVMGTSFVGLAVSMTSSVPAADFGASGQTWPIEEPDLLATIEAKLQTLQANGGMDQLNRRMADQARHRVMNPRPVQGITMATQARNWLFDPSMVADQDIRDHRGQIIAAAGTRANPLRVIELRSPLVFIDGSNEAELNWAIRRYGPQAAKIIFVNGSPFEQMGRLQRRFFFDQDGKLTSKFGIRHTPAVVTQEGENLRIEELVVANGGRP